jgi:phage terminase large subunit-like protein
MARKQRSAPTRAERNIAWCEKHLRLPEGKFVGQKLKMAEFMKDDFRAIYDNRHGTRRAIISRGRKNAKSTEAAMILLLHLASEEESRPNSQLFSTAQSREQAGVLFNLAAKMVRLSPTLHEHIVIKESAKQLIFPNRGTVYRALSAEASTAMGLGPAVVIHDELGQVRGPRSALYEALETATAAQEKPLSIIISTQAPTDNDLLSILIDDAKAGHDPRTVLRFQAASDDMDPFSVEAIRAANPAYDIFMNKAECLAMAADAKRMPARQAEYENLVTNKRVETSSPFISKSVWRECGGEVLADFAGKPVYAGLDLSETHDLTALVLIAPHEGKWHCKPTFWLPMDGLLERARKDRVPYHLWHQTGHLEVTPGRTVEYEYVAERLRGLFDQLDIRQLAFDRWNWKHLRGWLSKAGFSETELETKFTEFGQGFGSMSPALRDLESDLLSGKMVHADHPVLTMCAANSVVSMDPAGNRKLDKGKARGRIDGMIALLMARAVAATEELKPVPNYQIHIL